MSIKAAKQKQNEIDSNNNVRRIKDLKDKPYPSRTFAEEDELERLIAWAVLSFNNGDTDAEVSAIAASWVADEFDVIARHLREMDDGLSVLRKRLENVGIALETMQHEIKIPLLRVNSASGYLVSGAAILENVSRVMNISKQENYNKAGN